MATTPPPKKTPPPPPKSPPPKPSPPPQDKVVVVTDNYGNPIIKSGTTQTIAEKYASTTQSRMSSPQNLSGTPNVSISGGDLTAFNARQQELAQKQEAQRAIIQRDAYGNAMLIQGSLTAINQGRFNTVTAQGGQQLRESYPVSQGLMRPATFRPEFVNNIPQPREVKYYTGQIPYKGTEVKTYEQLTQEERASLLDFNYVNPFLGKGRPEEYEKFYPRERQIIEAAERGLQKAGLFFDNTNDFIFGQKQSRQAEVRYYKGKPALVSSYRVEPKEPLSKQYEKQPTVSAGIQYNAKGQPSLFIAQDTSIRGKVSRERNQLTNFIRGTVVKTGQELIAKKEIVPFIVGSGLSVGGELTAQAIENPVGTAATILFFKKAPVVLRRTALTGITGVSTLAAGEGQKLSTLTGNIEIIGGLKALGKGAEKIQRSTVTPQQRIIIPVEVSEKITAKDMKSLGQIRIQPEYNPQLQKSTTGFFSASLEQPRPTTKNLLFNVDLNRMNKQELDTLLRLSKAGKVNLPFEIEQGQRPSGIVAGTSYKTPYMADVERGNSVIGKGTILNMEANKAASEKALNLLSKSASKNYIEETNYFAPSERLELEIKSRVQRTGETYGQAYENIKKGVTEGEATRDILRQQETKAEFLYRGGFQEKEVSGSRFDLKQPKQFFEPEKKVIELESNKKLAQADKNFKEALNRFLGSAPKVKEVKEVKKTKNLQGQAPNPFIKQLRQQGNKVAADKARKPFMDTEGFGKTQLMEYDTLGNRQRLSLIMPEEEYYRGNQAIKREIVFPSNKKIELAKSLQPIKNIAGTASGALINFKKANDSAVYVSPKSSLSVSESTKSNLSLSQGIKNIQGESLRIRQDTGVSLLQSSATSVKSSTATKQAQSLKQNQLLRQELRQNLKQGQAQKTIVDIVEIQEPQLKQSPLFQKKKKALKKKQRAFAPFLKIKGKWYRVGKATSYSSALDVGASAAKKTLAATFKVGEVNESPVAIKTGQEYLRYQKQFRSYQTRKGKRIFTPGQFIQKRSYRLGTKSEVASIQAARKNNVFKFKKKKSKRLFF